MPKATAPTAIKTSFDEKSEGWTVSAKGKKYVADDIGTALNLCLFNLEPYEAITLHVDADMLAMLLR